MGKSKINPKRIPRSEADVIKAKDEGREEGLSLSVYIFLYALAKFQHMEKDQIQSIGHDCNYVAELVRQGKTDHDTIVKCVEEDFGFVWES